MACDSYKLRRVGGCCHMPLLARQSLSLLPSVVALGIALFRIGGVGEVWRSGQKVVTRSEFSAEV